MKTGNSPNAHAIAQKRTKPLSIRQVFGNNGNSMSKIGKLVTPLYYKKCSRPRKVFAS
jgi:hypothetical protein